MGLRQHPTRGGDQKNEIMAVCFVEFFECLLDNLAGKECFL